MKIKSAQTSFASVRGRSPLADPYPTLLEPDLSLASSDSCVHRLFSRKAAENPHARAVRWEHGSLSYAELDRKSSRLAAHLTQQGLRSGEPVGLFLDRSVEAVVGMLAILKADGAYLPLDPSYPADRLSFMLEDAQPRLVLTLSRLQESLPPCTAQAICIDKLPRNPGEVGSKYPLQPKVDPDHLAYIIYTSGSTGRPKGVLVGHRGLTNLAFAQIQEFGVRPDDNVLQFASLNFDASISEVWMTLLAGACLCLTPPDSLLAGSDLEHLLTEQAISVVTLTPSVLAVLRPLPFPALRVLIVAGEACPAELARQWSEDRDFFNAYGPTEVTVCATIAKCENILARPAIGTPIANTQAYLLDDRMKPVPAGSPGELYVGGIGLAWGYLKRPDLTADRFVPNPFSEDPGARLYRTGDLCCYLPDGNLDFLGRVDHQVKIRGIRIELGEIETVLGNHPKVRGNVVVPREDAQGKNRLVAYVIADSRQPVTIHELRHFLKQSLPDYAVPSTFVLVDSFALSPSGKVDRNALPAPDWVRDEQTAYLAPRTPLELQLAKTWTEVLGIDPIGIHDNFFELGGSSIQVVILAQKLQDLLQEYVYTVALFDAPTIAELALYLRQHYPAATKKVFGSDSADPSCNEDAVPLTFERVALFQKIVRTLPCRAEANGRPHRKNAPAVFVLSPPRSGSTLFRVMLAGHPRLFAPPELQLLNFNTLAERKQAFASERDRFWVNGTIRALMEIRGLDADAAEQLMRDCEQNGMTVQEFYALMQDGLGERILVDKTPTYALDPAMLDRAEHDFQDARFIHLVRQPGAVVSSFEEAKLHVFFPPFLAASHRGTPRQLAELVWYLSHLNIQSFLKKIPAERQHRVTFEEMVRDPQQTMEQVAKFLQLDFHSDMVQPHKEKKSRMTDPHHPQARMLGDVKFHEHQGIDARAAERFQQRRSEEPLAAFTVEFAASLGYDLAPARTVKLCGDNLNGDGEHDAHQVPKIPQMRSALVGIQLRGSRAPVFCVHPAGGTVLCYRPFASHLGYDHPVYGLQSVSAHGKHHGHRSIEAMAAQYIQEIQSVQPDGPYHLVGWSLGGVVAYEMAQQLSMQGKTIGLLGLLDSDLPRLVRKSRALAARRFLVDFAHQCGLDLPLEVLQEIKPQQQLPFLLEKAQAANLVPADLTLERFQQLYERNSRVFRANVRALRRYSAQPYSGKVLVLRAAERMNPASAETENCWQSLVEKMETHVVPGNHYTMMFAPLVRNLIEPIRKYLPV